MAVSIYSDTRRISREGEREKEEEREEEKGSGEHPSSSRLPFLLSPCHLLHVPQSHYSPSTRDCERARHADAFKATTNAGTSISRRKWKEVLENLTFCGRMRIERGLCAK